MVVGNFRERTLTKFYILFLFLHCIVSSGVLGCVGLCVVFCMLLCPSTEYRLGIKSASAGSRLNIL